MSQHNPSSCDTCLYLVTSREGYWFDEEQGDQYRCKLYPNFHPNRSFCNKYIKDTSKEEEEANLKSYLDSRQKLRRK